MKTMERERMDASLVTEWLLEESDPSVRFRTLTELLDVPLADTEAMAARKAIPTSYQVQQLLETMHPAGYWLQTDPRTLRTVGDEVEYGKFATTHFCLAYLAEMGMDRSHPKVGLAAERYLNLQKADGDWGSHFSCLFGYNIRTFLMLGYRGDKRLERSIDLLENSSRGDGGYLCDMHEAKGSRRAPKSCIRGSLKALAAFAALGPAYWKHQSCAKLLQYFLDREGIYQREELLTPVNKDVVTMLFPFHWRAGLVEVLYYLSMMGYGHDRRLKRAWAILASKTEPDGRFILEWTPTQSAWKVGKRGAGNKWMTLYALLARKAAGAIGFGSRMKT